MKVLIYILFSTSVALANPIQKMDQRIKVYYESENLCEDGLQNSDQGLFIDVSCAFQCKDLDPKIERVKGTFIPKNQGLIPGNGSNEKNTLWGALGVSLKVWSQKICFEKAIEGCKSVSKVESFGIDGLHSGKWSLAKFPGCHEKVISVSPFDNSAGSKRISSLAGLLTAPENSNSLDFSEFNLPAASKKAKCKKPIKAKLCFGDCIDLNTKEKEMAETLATSDPLGLDELEYCGDELDAKLKELKPSSSVRKEICEVYFWQSFMTMPSMYKSCAAIRGETNCETF